MRRNPLTDLRSQILCGLFVVSFAPDFALAGPNTPGTATRTEYHLDAQGDDVRTSADGLGARVARPDVTPPSPLFSLPLGRIWAHPDNGERWIGQVVSIGDRGGQVFTEFEIGGERAELLTGFDYDPATPMWQTASPGDLTKVAVDSAEAVPFHVALHQLPIPGSSINRTAVLSKYTSSSAAPQWSYTFPYPVQGATRVGISRDGSVIVAAAFRNYTSQLDVAVFGPNSPTPVSFDTLAIGPQLRGFDLSADGSTLYVSSHISLMVFDVQSRTVRCNLGLSGGFDSHAISGDGSVFAYGGYNVYDVWERNGDGSYARTYSRSLSGPVVCTRLDISDNSRTLVAGFNYYDLQLKVHIEAFDIPTKSVAMVDEPMGGGALQNVVSDISVDAAGQHFAVGVWGDESGMCPEVRLYDRDQFAPVATYNLPGSVFDVDISGRGDKVAVASKAVHANLFADGGEIGLYAFASDMSVRGNPRAGGMLSLEIAGQPGDQAIVYASPFLQSVPTWLPGIGTLYLRRNALSVIPAGVVQGDGRARVDVWLPGGLSAVGSTLYLQGLTTPPRRLTQDWVKVTILP